MQAGTPVALVTGGAQRIGAKICRQLHAVGYSIALHYRYSDVAAGELASELNALRPDSCRSYRAELLHRQHCADLAATVLADFQEVDLLVNNASAYFRTPVDSCPEADWNTLLDTNLKAPFFLCQALLESLRQCSGCIINIRHGLADVEGRRVTSIQILADSADGMGEPAWTLPDFHDTQQLSIRVRQEPPKNPD